jgi:hypothetical protein
MRQTLRRLAKQGARTYSSQDRCRWILQQPAQLVIAVSNIFWCQNVDAILSSTKALEQMLAFRDENIAQLAELTELVSSELTPLQRRVLVTLITVDVHNRDIVSKLVEEQCQAFTDFVWQMQLRCAEGTSGQLLDKICAWRVLNSSVSMFAASSNHLVMDSACAGTVSMPAMPPLSSPKLTSHVSMDTSISGLNLALW